MKQIEYIGPKAVKEDNVAGTGSIWYGAGDVVEVPDNTVLKFLAHPQVWKLVGLEGPRFSIKVGSGAKEQIYNLDIMSDQELRAIVRIHALEGVNHALRGDKLREAIVEAAHPVPPPLPPPEPLKPSTPSSDVQAQAGTSTSPPPPPPEGSKVDTPPVPPAPAPAPASTKPQRTPAKKTKR